MLQCGHENDCNSHSANVNRRRILAQYFLFGLAGAAVLFGIAHIVWFVGHNTVPPAWDESYHLSMLIEYSRLLTRGNVVSYLFSYHAYPPFAYQLFGAVYLVFSSPMFAPFTTNILLLTGLAFLIFWSTFSGRKPIDKLYVFAAVLLPFFTLNMQGKHILPWINLWEFMLDIPATVFVVAAHLALAEYLWGRRPKRTSMLLFILCFSFALGTRSQIAPYLLLPALMFIVRTVWKRQWGHLALLVAATAWTSVWYVRHWASYLPYVSLGLKGYGAENSIGLAGIYSYLKEIARVTRLMLFIPLSAGVLLLIDLVRRTKHVSFRLSRTMPIKFFLGNALIGLLVFSFLKNQDFRFILPSIMLLFMGSSYVLTLAYPKLVTTCVLIVIGSFTYTYMAYFPIPVSHQSAYTFVEEFVTTHPDALFAFYFETDSATYNLNNIQLLNIKQDRMFVASNNPNEWASKEEQTGCFVREPVTYLLIYTTNDAAQNPPGYFPSDVHCTDTLQKNNFRLLEKRYFPKYRETVFFYVKQ